MTNQSTDERTESITLIRESAAALVPDTRDLSRIRKLRFTEPGFSREAWTIVAEMGWLGLRLPFEAGGVGFGMAEYCALAEELGRGLAPEPLIEAALAAAVLDGADRDGLLSGARIILPAWQEAVGDPTRGSRTVLGGGRLTGEKLFVALAGGADAFLVAVSDGFALVEADAPGVTLALADRQDGGTYGKLSFMDVPSRRIAAKAEDFDTALDEAMLAASAYLLGLTDRAFAITLDHLKLRKQFGRTIGSFQALQHRAVDIKMQAALSRASVASAAAAIDNGLGPTERRARISAAKARTSEAAMLATREALQMHGAIGYTDESDIGLYIRKAMVFSTYLGSPSWHRRRYGIETGLVDAA